MRSLPAFALATFSPLLLASTLLPSHTSAADANLLLFTRTVGYRHTTIPVAISTITQLGKDADPASGETKWTTTASEDPALFEDYERLTSFDAVAFAYTTDVDPPGVGTILSDAGIANFQRYVESGGNFVGVHSGTNALYGTPWFGRLAGSYFDYHPPLQEVTFIAVDDNKHPSTRDFPKEGIRVNEEVYHFRTDPRALPTPANLLLSNGSAFSDPSGVNAQGFRNGTDGPAPRPTSWWREGGLLNGNGRLGFGLDDPQGTTVSGGPGRAWVSSLGHDERTWSNEDYKTYVRRGISWVLQSGTLRAANASSTIGTATSSSSGIASTTGSGSGASASSSGSPNAASRLHPLSLRGALEPLVGFARRRH